MATQYVFEKICTKCKRVLPLSEFYANKGAKYGRTEQCKDCVSAYVKANRQKVNESLRKWGKKNPQSLRESGRKWREKNPDYQKTWREKPENKAKRARENAERRQNQPEKARARDIIGGEIRSGRMVRLACQFCGDPNTEAHHPDYSKPKDVIWVCHRCHIERFHAKSSEVQK